VNVLSDTFLELVRRTISRSRLMPADKGLFARVNDAIRDGQLETSRAAGS